MRRTLILGTLLLLVTLVSAFAENATVTQISGKVQLLAPGGNWENAHVGSSVSPLTVVATGFGSSCVLNLGTSHIQVQALTRMRLLELLRNKSTATTSVYLTVGAVHANVADNLGITQKFRIQSPVSTASVRGTIFDFTGYSLTVDRGIVHYTTPEGFGRNITVGQSSTLSNPYVPGSAESFQQAEAQTSTNTNTNSGGGGGTSTATTPGSGATAGAIVVTIK